MKWEFDKKKKPPQSTSMEIKRLILWIERKFDSGPLTGSNMTDWFVGWYFGSNNWHIEGENGRIPDKHVRCWMEIKHPDDTMPSGFLQMGCIPQKGAEWRCRMSQTFKEIMDEVSGKHPLTCNFEEDARYVWPAMWDDLYERAKAAAPLPATAKVEMPESCCNCPAKTKCDYYAKGPK